MLQLLEYLFFFMHFLILEWNADYHNLWVLTGRRARMAMLALQPGLHVKMNVNKRQEYCAKNGINFEMPQAVGAPNIQQPPSMVNPHDPPPAYPGSSAPYPPTNGAFPVPSNQYGMQQV